MPDKTQCVWMPKIDQGLVPPAMQIQEVCKLRTAGKRDTGVERTMYFLFMYLLWVPAKVEGWHLV